LYVFYGLAQLQIFHARNDVLATGHFWFNKTMELMFQNY
jgi:hypothetical protein